VGTGGLSNITNLGGYDESEVEDQKVAGRWQNLDAN
jgi:hypothetical protein